MMMRSSTAGTCRLRRRALPTQTLAWPPVQVTPLYWTMGTLLDEAMTADGSYSDDEIYACGTLLQVRPSASLCRWRRPAAPSALISVLSNALSCLVIGGLAAQPHT